MSHPFCNCSNDGKRSTSTFATTLSSARNATRSVLPCATGNTTLPAGNSMPCAPRGLGVRDETTSGRVNATAIGNVDSFVISITTSPPASATAYTRWIASPPGIRKRVSITGTPARRVCRTLGSVDGSCQRSSAAMCQSSTGEPSLSRIEPRSLTIAFHPPPLMPNTWAAGRTRALSEIDEITPCVLDIIQTYLISTSTPAENLQRSEYLHIRARLARQSASPHHVAVPT